MEGNNNESHLHGVQIKQEVVDEDPVDIRHDAGSQMHNMVPEGGLMNLNELFNYACGPNGSYVSNLFTSDDLCSVLDPDNPACSVTDIGENDSSMQQVQTFIPINSSGLNQIQGSGVRTVTETDGTMFSNNPEPHLSLMVNNDGKMEKTRPGGVSTSIENGNSSSHQVSNGENGSGSHYGLQVSEVRVSNEGISGVETVPPSPAPKRKPRGRKPKISKQADATSADTTPRITGNENYENGLLNSPPNVVVHHTAGYNSATNQNTVSYSMSAPSQQTRIYSMEQLRSMDRNNALARISNNGPAGINTDPRSTLRRAESVQGQGQGCVTVTDVNGMLRANSSAGVDLRLNYPQSIGNNQHQQFNQAGAKMEQMFVNRISGVGASKRHTVAPALIQRNMSLYTQLTTPTSLTKQKQSDFEKERAQDKWMQVPNPSVAQVDTSERRSNRIIENGASFGIQRQSESVVVASYSTGMGNNLQHPHLTNGNGSVVQNVAADRNCGVNRQSNFNIGNIGTNGSSFGSYQMNPNGNGYPNQQAPGSFRQPTTMSNNVFTNHNQMNGFNDRDRVNALEIENYELRIRGHCMQRGQKQLLARMKAILEQNEGLKWIIQQMRIQQIPQPGYVPSSRMNMDTNFNSNSATAVMNHSNGMGIGNAQATAANPIWNFANIKQEQQEGGVSVHNGSHDRNQVEESSFSSSMVGQNLKRKMEQEQRLGSVGCNKKQCIGVQDCKDDVGGSEQVGDSVNNGNIVPEVEESQVGFEAQLEDYRRSWQQLKETTKATVVGAAGIQTGQNISRDNSPDSDRTLPAELVDSDTSSSTQYDPQA